MRNRSGLLAGTAILTTFQRATRVDPESVLLLHSSKAPNGPQVLDRDFGEETGWLLFTLSERHRWLALEIVCWVVQERVQNHNATLTIFNIRPWCGWLMQQISISAPALSLPCCLIALCRSHTLPPASSTPCLHRHYPLLHRHINTHSLCTINISPNCSYPWTPSRSLDSPLTVATDASNADFIEEWMVPQKMR